jgi:hypothetical protein
MARLTAVGTITEVEEVEEVEVDKPLQENVMIAMAAMVEIARTHTTVATSHPRPLP